MKFITVDKDNLELLNLFINSLTSEKLSFRYYEKRSIDVIKDHLCTVLLLEDDKEPVAYGHLDKEDNIWLGIAVLKNKQRMGYGNRVLEYLLKRAKELNLNKVKLSVDKSNLSAISLYEKAGFLKVGENFNSYFYEKVI